MSYHPSTQIKALSATITDIHIRTDQAESGPRAIGDILRPFILELRRSRMTGEPMRKEILDRFCAPQDAVSREAAANV